MKKMVILLTLLLTLGAAARTPVKIILDTDTFTDYDDVGALAMLHAMADQGEAEILATISCTRDNSSVGTIEIINWFYGRANIPVGCTKGDYGISGAPPRHQKYSDLLKLYPGRFKYGNSSDAPDAVKVYRKILASQEDESVVICTIGFLTNIRLLLESTGDEFSPLNGIELVRRKVKMWVAMACNYPNGKEFNSMRDWKSSKIALDKFPRPIVFSDFQYGAEVHSGRRAAEKNAPNNPVSYIFRRALPSREECAKQNKNKKPGDVIWENDLGRCSWDQTAVLAAVRGVDAYFAADRGTYVMVGEEGANEWRPDPKSRNCRLTVKTPKAEVGKIIDELIVRDPKAK